MARLLAGDHPVLATLRDQASRVASVVREFTGVGFWTDIELAEDAPRTPIANFELTDVYAEAASLERGVGFILFVRDGFAVQLEGVTYGEPWPKDLGEITLHYIADDDRGETLARLDEM